MQHRSGGPRWIRYLLNKEFGFSDGVRNLLANTLKPRDIIIPPNKSGEEIALL